MIFIQIGIMADSHDNIPAIRSVVDLFNQKEVKTVLHAGDLISPFTAQEFKGLNSKFEAIYGNNDGERAGLKLAYSEMCVLEDFKEVKANGRKIAMIHGNNEALVNALEQSGIYDVVIRGHTHIINVSDGPTLVLNPGETCGYLSGKKSVLILYLDDLSYETVIL
ncbi:MAG: YfcE family phosphodiesterase [Methanobacteriales archaeon Met13]